MEHRADQARIDRERIASDWQIEYWAMKLGKSADQIEDAIDEVGDRIADVRQYFFCGPPCPVVRTAAATVKAKPQEKTRPPILDWLLSPSLCGFDGRRMLAE